MWLKETEEKCATYVENLYKKKYIVKAVLIIMVKKIWFYIIEILVAIDIENDQ